MRKEELVKEVAKARQEDHDGGPKEGSGSGSGKSTGSGNGKAGNGKEGRDKPGNQTPNTPDVSETELRSMKVDELRKEAREEHIAGVSGLRKEELVKEVAKARQESAGDSRDEDAGGDAEDLGAGPDGGKIRYGDESSKSLKYSQEITSTEEEPEREGRSLATTHHEVIRQWAEERGGVPATVDGTEHGDHLGVLRIDFRDRDANLREVSWEEWFKTFDDRRLNFIYQEERTDGNQSNFFRLENPEREDA
ncbi:Rho termination factor N-terminal domain-containing protein [Arthrobacter sp. ISL-85]|nr:Rho termination factor N-terminal domain-containing protein [Arthrobacter sp. ISL-85]